MTERFKTIILPKISANDKNEFEYSLVSMVHPRSLESSLFLTVHGSSQIFELTSITSTRRLLNKQKSEHADPKSIFIENTTSQNSTPENETPSYIISDPSLVICTPFSPLYFTLSTLYKHKDTFLFPENLHDFLESETLKIDATAKSLDYETFRSCIYNVCEAERPDDKDTKILDSTNRYKLSTQKLFSYLDSIAEKIVKAGLPQDIYQQMVVLPLLSSNIEEKSDEKMVLKATERAAVQLVCSNLAPEVCKDYLSTKDYTDLDELIKKLEIQRKALRAEQERLNQPMGGAQKRPAISSSKQAANKKKELKKTPAKSKLSSSVNSKSITSFFAAKPAKKSKTT